MWNNWLLIASLKHSSHSPTQCLQERSVILCYIAVINMHCYMDCCLRKRYMYIISLIMGSFMQHKAQFLLLQYLVNLSLHLRHCCEHGALDTGAAKCLPLLQQLLEYLTICPVDCLLLAIFARCSSHTFTKENFWHCIDWQRVVFLWQHWF